MVIRYFTEHPGSTTFWTKHPDGQRCIQAAAEWIAANAPGVQLLPVQYGDGDQAKSADITKSILGANPGVKGIYGPGTPIPASAKDVLEQIRAAVAA